MRQIAKKNLKYKSNDGFVFQRNFQAFYQGKATKYTKRDIAFDSYTPPRVFQINTVIIK